MVFLLGRITIDDIVDVIKEEADKDYQLAAGLTQDVEADDSILQLTKARLPWLFLGLLGGVGAFLIMVMFENTFDENAVLFFFYSINCSHGRKCGGTIFCNYCARIGQ